MFKRLLHKLLNLRYIPSSHDIPARAPLIVAIDGMNTMATFIEPGDSADHYVVYVNRNRLVVTRDQISWVL